MNIARALAPQHPYTQGLLASVVREGGAEIPAIPGRTDLRRPPPGGALAIEPCTAAIPAERAVEPGQTALCIRVGECLAA